MDKPFLRRSALSLFVLSSLWLSFAAAWLSLSSVNFAYGQLYDLIEINSNIAQFGPQNRFKNDFEKTDREEHLRIFGEIVRAINDNGRGLAQIEYFTADGKRVDRFLREAEVIHLQDVANLLASLRILSLCMLVIFSALCVLYTVKRWVLPPVRVMVMWVGIVLVALTVVVVLIGPTKVFYAGHEVVFPKGHQWFFYYQESLMTTLMKAPDIFGYIAILLLLVMSVLWAAMISGIRYLLSRRAKTAHG